MGKLTKETHEQWMKDIMQRLMNNDTSYFVEDVSYLKGRLSAANARLAKLEAFVRRVADNDDLYLGREAKALFDELKGE